MTQGSMSECDLGKVYEWMFYNRSSLRDTYFEGTLPEWNIVRMCSDSPVTYPVLVHCADGDTVLT